MLKYLAGLNPSCASLYSMREDTAVVWVLRRFFSASVSFQGLPYLHDHQMQGKEAAPVELETPAAFM